MKSIVWHIDLYENLRPFLIGEPSLVSKILKLADKEFRRNRQHFLLCHQALSNAFFVCAAPPSCLGQDSQANMILRQNHRSRTLPHRVCRLRLIPAEEKIF